MLPIDANTMRALVSVFKGIIGVEQKRIIDGIGPLLRERLDQYQVNTPLRIAHFLAQCAHETAGFRTLVEFGNGKQYEGRKDLGNIRQNDGPRYRGRGMLQITGRANYAEMGVALDLDLVNQPDLLALPDPALRASLEFWSRHKLNTWADRDDVVTVTKIINGGANGLEERRTYLSKAKNLMARLVAMDGRVMPDGTLHRGMIGENVAIIQRILRDHGADTLGVDGNFGPATELAVVQAQKDAGLPVDGIVGPATGAMLKSLDRT